MSILQNLKSVRQDPGTCDSYQKAFPNKNIFIKRGTRSVNAYFTIIAVRFNRVMTNNNTSKWKRKRKTMQKKPTLLLEGEEASR